MASRLRDQDITDLLNTTHPAYMDKASFVDISSEISKFIVMPYLLTRKGGVKEISNGMGVEQLLMTDFGGRSRWVGEFEEDVHTLMDHLKKMKVYFKLLNDSVIYTKTMIVENRGDARIANVFEPAIRALWLRVAHTMEENFFETPDASATLTPWGLKYWIVKNATEGFNGGYPAGFTSIAEVSLTDAPTFKNYTNTYVAATKADLVLKMKRAHRKTKWISPKPMANFKGDTSDNQIILCNEDTAEALETIGEGQNENLGRDLAPYSVTLKGTGLRISDDGEITFKRKQIFPTEMLNDDTTDPLYGLDMDTFHALTFSGENMVLGDFVNMAAGNQHRVWAANLDHKHQTICTNRRNNWVINK
jgi:hypothetical protein